MVDGGRVLVLGLGGGSVGGVEGAVHAIHLPEACPGKGGHQVGHLGPQIHDNLFQILDLVYHSFILFKTHLIHSDLIDWDLAALGKR